MFRPLLISSLIAGALGAPTLHAETAIESDLQSTPPAPLAPESDVTREDVTRDSQPQVPAWVIERRAELGIAPNTVVSDLPPAEQAAQPVAVSTGAASAGPAAGGNITAPAPRTGRTEIPDWVRERGQPQRPTAAQMPDSSDRPATPEWVGKYQQPALSAESQAPTMPSRPEIPEWVSQRAEPQARPERPARAALPDWVRQPARMVAPAASQAAPLDRDPGMAPSRPYFEGGAPMPAYSGRSSGNPYGGWGPQQGGWGNHGGNNWMPWGNNSGWGNYGGGNNWMPWGNNSGWGNYGGGNNWMPWGNNSGWGNYGGGNNWMPWGNNSGWGNHGGGSNWMPWGNSGWGNNGSGWGDAWGDSRGYGWSDGSGDAAGDLDFSFELRGRADLDMRGQGSGYGAGDGVGRGYGHQGYLPYHAYPPAIGAAPAAVQPEQPTAPPDSDSDGVADSTDLCPDSVAGVSVDAFGCADEARIVLRGVNFKTDSDELTEQSLAILDGVSATLSANPGIKVMVAGHTDSDGEDAYNKDLSQRRAQSVVDYLAGQGVDRNNMIARGFGEEQPIADNASAEGKAQNRRVELNRL